jgi:hypothetical protein
MTPTPRRQGFFGQNFFEKNIYPVQETIIENPFLPMLQSSNSLFHDLDATGRRLAYSGFPVTFPARPGIHPEETTPFNRWRLVPAENFDARKFRGRPTVDVTLHFDLTGFHVEGLTGLSSDPDCPRDDVAEFTKCKYEGKVPFFGMTDIVTAMSLPEINRLLKVNVWLTRKKLICWGQCYDHHLW